MFSIFGSLRGVIRWKSVTTDNVLFRLHYQVTVVLLLAFSLMFTARQYFGDPIDCVQRLELPPNLLDTYCWIHSTFSVDSAWNGRVGSEIPYPGVNKSPRNGYSESRTYHRYYQWMWFVLFGQAILFYLPHYFWKRTERGLVASITLGLEKAIVPEEEKTSNLGLLLEFIQTARVRALHQRMLTVYLACEMANFLNIILQMLLVDHFLGGAFLNYGWNVLTFTGDADGRPMEVNPMLKLFPRLAKCEYFQYGQSGEVVRYDTMCLLPVNILAEKVYLFLWFWLVGLGSASLLLLPYRLVQLLTPSLRSMSLWMKCNTLSLNCVRNVLRCGKLGDWFLLHLLAKNLHSLHFHELMESLERERVGWKSGKGI